MIVAALIAVRGQRDGVPLRARRRQPRHEEQEPVQVLKATGQIEPGETANAAMAAGKLELEHGPEGAGARSAR